MSKGLLQQLLEPIEQSADTVQLAPHQYMLTCSEKAELLAQFGRCMQVQIAYWLGLVLLLLIVMLRVHMLKSVCLALPVLQLHCCGGTPSKANG